MTVSPGGVGVVVIGRNEGARLVACLESLGELRACTVYVDSGSTDGSQAHARSAGVSVVNLDQSTAFTAARARNAGFRALVGRYPTLEYVQFVDGDCALDAGWIGAARQLLEDQGDVALVCGRRRERFPDRSIYNAMCDQEWDGPTGLIIESGGDFLVRTSCFSAVRGFRESLIAGEEPELCLRLRERNWQIWRLAREMTLHDANIVHFSQWWRRTVRAGHAFAEVSALHRKSPQRIWQRNTLRAMGWAAVAPVAVLGSLISPWSLGLLLAYPADIARQSLREGGLNGANWRGAVFSMLGKFAEAQGVLKYHLDHALGRRSELIEYK